MNRDHILPAGLSMAAGFVEAVCFIGLFHTFTTYITGTVMIMMIDLIQSDPGAATKAVTFFAFFLFTILWVALIRIWRAPEDVKISVFLMVEGVLIAVFATVGHMLSPLAAPDAIATYIVSVFGVFAMSLHSALFFQMLNKSAPSHFMTGNVTNFTRGLVDLVIVDPLQANLSNQEHKDARFRIVHFPLILGSFIVGVGAGTLGLRELGFVCLVFPAVLVFALGIRCWFSR